MRSHKECTLSMNVGDCSLHRCYWLKLDLAFRHFDFLYFIELTPRWLHFTTLVTFKWTFFHPRKVAAINFRNIRVMHRRRGCRHCRRRRRRRRRHDYYGDQLF